MGDMIERFFNSFSTTQRSVIGKQQYLETGPRLRNSLSFFRFVQGSGIRVEGYFSQEGSVLRERLQSLL